MTGNPASGEWPHLLSPVQRHVGIRGDQCSRIRVPRQLRREHRLGGHPAHLKLARIGFSYRLGEARSKVQLQVDLARQARARHFRSSATALAWLTPGSSSPPSGFRSQRRTRLAAASGDSLEQRHRVTQHRLCLGYRSRFCVTRIFSHSQPSRRAAVPTGATITQLQPRGDGAHES